MSIPPGAGDFGLTRPQAEAEFIDEKFRDENELPDTVPHFCADWSLYEQLGLMETYIALGVELQLFTWYECDSVFWYWDYLLSARLRLQTSFAANRQQVERQKAAIAAQVGGSPKSSSESE